MVLKAILAAFYVLLALYGEVLKNPGRYFTFQALQNLVLLLISAVLFLPDRIWRRLRKPGVQELMAETLHRANTYEEWEAAALQLDQLSGMDTWRTLDSGLPFNPDELRNRTKALHEALDAKNVRRLRDIMRCGVTRGFGGIWRNSLFSKALAGTNYLVTEYATATCEAFKMIAQMPSSKLDPESLSPQQKLELLHDIRMSFGRSALVLQGGSIFGLCHLGVIKELLHQNLLPRIIAGSATGAMMAALVCVHTDDELPAFLHGDGINLNYFAASSMRAQQDSPNGPSQFEAYRWICTFRRRMRRYLTSGFVLDPAVLGKSVQANIGDLTFEEAYNRTKRILNITISSTGPGAITLLNYITAPHVLIWSAAMVSNVADPRTSPLRLKCVDIDGSIVDYSIPSTSNRIRPRQRQPPKSDQESPLGRLGELFNVNHFIVSQARPYIAPLLYPSFRGPHPGWSVTTGMWRFVFSEANFRVRQLNALGLLSPGMARLLMDEIVPGPSVTLVPEVTWYDWTRLLRNPTAEEINHWIKRGERSVWPLVKQLEVKLCVEFEIDRGYQMVRRGDDVRLIEQAAVEQREEALRERQRAHMRTSSAGHAL